MGTNKGTTMWVQDVQDTCAHIQFQYGPGNPLGEDANLYLAQVFAYTGALVLDLLPDCAASRADTLSWLKCYKGSVDIEDFGQYLKRADSALKTFVSESYLQQSKGDQWSYERFKRSVSPGKHSRHLSIMKEPIESLIRDCDPHSFRILNTWFNFLRRCNLPGLDLSEECEAEYVAFEAEMATWVYPQETVKDLAAIVQEWFSDFDYSGFVPKHGPGSVSTREGRLPQFLKYEDCRSSDYLLQYFERDIGRLEDWLPWSSTHLAENCYTRGTALARGEKINRTSELICVPKSIITNRTISKEPAFLQYLQQGVKNAIVEFIAKHPFLRSHIDFKRQNLSQDMALEGSIFGELATIDLSAASDSVTTELVWELFRPVPRLLRGLICTRSKATELPSERVLPLRKFAPMGSAVCFPIETIVFSACCELACRRCRSQLFNQMEEDMGTKAAASRRNWLPRFRWRVYGDDIVISTDAVPYLREILTSCHFKVNDGKSYWNEGILGNFREACGIEALDGFDVTPLRIPRFFRGINAKTMSSADGVVAAQSLANNAFDYGAYNLRRLILKDMGDITPFPFTTTGFLGLKTWEYCCTNFRTESRMDSTITDVRRPCYYRLEHKVAVAVACRDCDKCSRYRRGTRFATRKGSVCPVISKRRKGKWKMKGRTTKSPLLPASLLESRMIGDPETDFLSAGYETVRYHAWFLQHRTSEDQPCEGLTFACTGDCSNCFWAVDCRESGLEWIDALRPANEPTQLCLMRSQLKERWAYLDE